MEQRVPVSLSELYLRHGFTTPLLDIRAGVPSGTTDRMIQNIPVRQEHAERVLEALSGQTGQHYSFSNVTVNLIDEEEPRG